MSTEPRTITDKQVNFILNLLDQREVPEHVQRTIGQVSVVGLSKQAASEIISALLDAPEKAGATNTREAKDANYGIPSADTLPTGRYAIDNADGELTFYRVWRGTRNPDYVKVYVLHGPDETEVPFSKGLVTITKAIAADAANAAVRYGHEIGACSVCAKRLTNRVSRALGIGPVCGGHFYGEQFKQVVSNAREQIKAAGLDPDENVEEYEDVVRYDVNADLADRDEQVRQYNLVTAAEKVEAAEELGEILADPRATERNAAGAIDLNALLDDLQRRTDAELEGIVAYAREILNDRAFAQREREQENAAYEAKMQRDQSFLGR